MDGEVRGAAAVGTSLVTVEGGTAGVLPCRGVVAVAVISGPSLVGADGALYVLMRGAIARISVP